MELKEYQEKALQAFDGWREILAEAGRKSEAGMAALAQAGVPVPPDLRNFPKIAWETLRDSGELPDAVGPYVDRTDAADRAIPHVCFKVPTGGGKTLLAAASLERLAMQTGLVLWIMPTRAIYQQTRKALKSREHPYRQMLERASGERVKLLEKDDPFTASDVANYLCVMLLMLPAANRQKGREFLRMFRDSGRYPTLFPDSDDALGDARLLAEYPDLERTSDGGPVKHSLFNVFKMLRPVVVLDEAHKAYGVADAEAREFVRSVNQLDPRLVIELSATPHRSISNLLVDITGVELKSEEMIKLPVQVTSHTGAEWKHTLLEALDKLDELGRDADSLQHSEGRYIRPIGVVRVERTGKDQRDGERVHAEDVRDYLVQSMGVPSEAVAVKSSERDDIGQEDLLSELSQVRWIITKAALMEGWDCPFAYVLVMLDNTQAQRALTQLVGRVMRQPHARRTLRDSLDQCYVYCRDTQVGVAVSQVKAGLEQEGLTGLGDEVFGTSSEFRRVTVQRREQFQGKDIFLPKVLHADGDGWIELDYQRHILSAIDWNAVNDLDPQAMQPDAAKRFTATVDVGPVSPVFHPVEELYIEKTLSTSWFARRLSDVVPNPWQAAHIAQAMVTRIRSAGVKDDQIFDRRSDYAFMLREHVRAEVEKQGEHIYRSKLKHRIIRFDLEAGQPNFRMKPSYELPLPDETGIMAGKDGRALQLSLFEPIYTQHFDSNLERNFARYLDEQKALHWWHRVAVRQQGDYYLRGWKQDRIWPDFIAMAGEQHGKPHLLIFETKGEHLRGNPDTEYKRQVLETLEDAFNVGKLTINDGPARGTFQLVFNESEFPIVLADLASSYAP